jgi:putative transposase
MEKVFRFRFYPTPEQESLLRRTLGCVRLIYNKALHIRTQAWYEKQERVGYPDTSRLLTQWKKEEDLDFLNEVSSVPLQQGLRHLQTAFTNFLQEGQNTPTSRRREMVVVQSLQRQPLSLKTKKFTLLNVLTHYQSGGLDN